MFPGQSALAQNVSRGHTTLGQMSLFYSAVRHVLPYPKRNMCKMGGAKWLSGQAYSVWGAALSLEVHSTGFVWRFARSQIPVTVDIPICDLF